MLKLKLCLCIVSAAVLGLTTHILVQNWTKPIIEVLVHGHPGSDGNYSVTVVSFAYLTALITMLVNVLIYYYAGHLLPFKNKIAKGLVLTALLLETSGSLLREPIVNYFYAIDCGVAQPVLFAICNQLDKWIPKLVVAFLLVYFCPLRKRPDGVKPEQSREGQLLCSSTSSSLSKDPVHP